MAEAKSSCCTRRASHGRGSSLTLGKERPSFVDHLKARMKEKKEVFSVSDGDAYFWVEQESSVMLKAVTGFGDPVELSKEEAIALANALLKAADEI